MSLNHGASRLWPISAIAQMAHGMRSEEPAACFRQPSWSARTRDGAAYSWPKYTPAAQDRPRLARDRITPHSLSSVFQRQSGGLIARCHSPGPFFVHLREDELSVEPLRPNASGQTCSRIFGFLHPFARWLPTDSLRQLRRCRGHRTRHQFDHT